MDSFGCTIHKDLRPQGFAGCTVFDRFGAGQQVTQVTFLGRDWRQRAEIAEQMFEVFAIMRALHELLWYLTQALAIPSAQAVHPAITDAIALTEGFTQSSADQLVDLDVEVHRREVNALLQEVSELVRSEVTALGTDYRGADLRNASFERRPTSPELMFGEPTFAGPISARPSL